MKNIEKTGLTELTHDKCVQTEGGLLPVILAVVAAVFGITAGCIAVIGFGYWVGKAVL